MKLTDDVFYDKIDIKYLLEGNGNGYIYTSDIMRFFGIGINQANEMKPKIKELADKLRSK